jgi:hypothetical protein
MDSLKSCKNHHLATPANFILPLLFGLFLVVPVQAQNNQDRKEIRAYHLDNPEEFVFDGRVDEGFWSRIEPAGGFLQQEPNEGAPGYGKNRGESCLRQ